MFVGHASYGTGSGDRHARMYIHSATILPWEQIPDSLTTHISGLPITIKCEGDRDIFEILYRLDGKQQTAIHYGEPYSSVYIPTGRSQQVCTCPVVPGYGTYVPCWLC